ncbi:hypothetical protein GJAV_G00154490 [Gymnothorax javanicus]|nr:hypothetical protein GJAV_G00154490 [Gymnothorax javanicus]
MGQCFLGTICWTSNFYGKVRVFLRTEQPSVQNRFKYACVTDDTDWDRLTQDHPWLLTERLVVKPDQLIKRRGKLGLVGINLDLEGVKEWLQPRLMQEIAVGRAKGILKNFLIEPFVAHKQEEEFYVCIYAMREGDYVLFHHEGGVDVGAWTPRPRSSWCRWAGT